MPLTHRQLGITALVIGALLGGGWGPRAWAGNDNNSDLQAEYGETQEDRQEVEEDVKELDDDLDELRGDLKEDVSPGNDLRDAGESQGSPETPQHHR